MDQQTIRHMVIFNLKAQKGTDEAERFLSDGKTILESIPVVKQFEVLYQVSRKNDYDYGFSMEFSSQADYEAYNVHPNHELFVRDRWEKEVERFLEIDFLAR